MSVLQGGKINGARQLLADGTKLPWQGDPAEWRGDR
jgi:hypothetical protein